MGQTVSFKAPEQIHMLKPSLSMYGKKRARNSQLGRCGKPRRVASSLNPKPAGPGTQSDTKRHFCVFEYNFFLGPIFGVQHLK